MEIEVNLQTYLDYCHGHLQIIAKHKCINGYLFVTDGSPDGFCSDTLQCKDANSVCSSGICRCSSAFRNIGGECLKGNGII